MEEERNVVDYFAHADTMIVVRDGEERELTGESFRKVMHALQIMTETALQMPWTIFTMSGFIKNVPRELDEAAFIDGATPVRTFFSVIFPLLKPIVATVIVTTAMGAWNEFMVPLYFFNSSSKWTMPLTVYNFFGQYSSDWNYVFADLVLTALPITILYLLCQKYVVAGATAGAVKG